MTILSGARLISGVERSEVKGKSIERVRLSNGAEEAGKAAADLVGDEGGPGVVVGGGWRSPRMRSGISAFWRQPVVLGAWPEPLLLARSGHSCGSRHLRFS